MNPIPVSSKSSRTTDVDNWDGDETTDFTEIPADVVCYSADRYYEIIRDHEVETSEEEPETETGTGASGTSSASTGPAKPEESSK